MLNSERYINNSAGFATVQSAYDKAVKEIFEDILSHQCYLTGPPLTEADIRLYTTLVKFASSCICLSKNDTFL